MAKFPKLPLLTLAAALAVNPAAAQNPPTPEALAALRAKIERHCEEVGLQAWSRPPPFVHDAYGRFVPNLMAYGFGQGLIAGAAPEVAENECRLRHGLAPK